MCGGLGSKEVQLYSTDTLLPRAIEELEELNRKIYHFPLNRRVIIQERYSD